MESKIVINDIKTGKSYQKTLDNNEFLGKKIGEIVDGNLVGLKGYELKVTGGSDIAGFPMRKSVEGSGLKKVLIDKGAGLRRPKKWLKVRKGVRGNTIMSKTSQINLRVKKYGSKSIEELFGIKKEEIKEPMKEEKVEAKDKQG